MILGWADVQKEPSDVKTVPIDWTEFAPAGATITAHSVGVDLQDVDEVGYGSEIIPVGMGGVCAQDVGVTALMQSIKLTGGNVGSYSIIMPSVTFSDGTKLTRGFLCLVR